MNDCPITVWCGCNVPTLKHRPTGRARASQSSDTCSSTHLGVAREGSRRSRYCFELELKNAKRTGQDAKTSHRTRSLIKASRSTREPPKSGEQIVHTQQSSGPPGRITRHVSTSEALRAPCANPPKTRRTRTRRTEHAALNREKQRATR